MIIKWISNSTGSSCRNFDYIPKCSAQRWMNRNCLRVATNTRRPSAKSCCQMSIYNTKLDYNESTKIWNIYLSGEIHSDWRQEIANGVEKHNLPIELTFPVYDHTDSDDCGAYILGMVEERPQWDMMGAKMNAIRTQTLIKQCDIVIVKFGEQYRQWNAAYDVGYAAAHQKSIITIHPPSLSHMLKEINATANVVCSNTEQAVNTLKYIIHGNLTSQPPKDGETYVPIADRLGKGNPNP